MSYWSQFNSQLSTTKVDETGAPGVIYVGYASAWNDSNTNLPRRTIKRVTDDGAGNTAISFAGRKTSATNIWDDRTSLIYG
jgi:hypothetical protein